MVRFQRILEVIEEDNLVENAAEAGEYLLKKIKELADEEEHLTNARGKGLFCAIDLPDSQSRDAVLKECFKNHLMILGCGSKSIRFRPPLTVQKEQLDEGIDILRKSYRAAVEKNALTVF